MEAPVSIRTGTAAGTLLSVLPNIFSQDIVRTIILAVVGASVSFLVTLFLKWVVLRRK